MNKNFNYTTGSGGETTGSGGGVDYMGLITKGFDMYSNYKQSQTTQTTTQPATQPTNVTITPSFQLGDGLEGLKDTKSTITWNVSGGAGTTPPEKKDNTLMFVGIGVTVLVISIIAFILIKKKGF